VRTITIPQACARYGTGRTSIMRYAEQGRLHLYRVGANRIRLDADELDKVFHGPLVGSDADETVTA
jgi:excisionase family DNA binding protein